MKFKNTDRLLKLRFLSKHRKDIKAEYLKHTSKTGYAFTRAAHLFHAAGKPTFIERSFDELAFIKASPEKSKWAY